MAKTSSELVAEAVSMIETIRVDAAIALLGDDQVQFIDVREKGELRREGIIPGAVNVPRGMLEFWLDPESPYFKPVFAPGKRFVFFCAAGWRSALATRTASEMGLKPVCHIAGGFDAWRDGDGPIEPLAVRREDSKSPGGNDTLA